MKVVSVKADGLMGKLKTLEKSIDKIARPIMRDAAKEMRDAVLPNIPRDRGWLARNLKVRALKRRRGRVGFAAKWLSHDDKNRWYVSTLVYGIKKPNKKGTIANRPPNDFMRVAFDGSKDDIGKKARTRLWRGIVAQAKS